MEEDDERGEIVRQPAMEFVWEDEDEDEDDGDDDEICEKKGCILSSALLLCILDDEDDFPEECN